MKRGKRVRKEVETLPGSSSEPDKGWIRICFLDIDKNNVLFTQYSRCHRMSVKKETVKIGVTSVLKLLSAA